MKDGYAMLGEILRVSGPAVADQTLARMAFQRAAANAHPLAELRLAEADLKPDSTADMRAEAQRTIQRLAQSAFVEAQYSLGYHHLSGSFGKADSQSASFPIFMFIFNNLQNCKICTHDCTHEISC